MEKVYTREKVKISNGRCTVPEGYTSIGDWTFYGCESLESITLPDSIASIGNYAFYRCESLKSITLPDSITSIGDYAFYRCESLKSITLPDSITSIGNSAFFECESLKSITLPDSITSIGDWTFYGCESLESITLPDSITSIGNYAFYRCESLKSIVYHGNHCVKCVDGYCMEIHSVHKVGDYTLSRASYFYSEDKCIIAEKDKYYAHGSTAKEAIQDLEFKLCESRGMDQYKGYTMDTQVDYMFYRVLTGACSEGTKRFLHKNGLTTEDKLTIREVEKITRGEYGHDQLIYNLRRLEIMNE